ncbi:serine/threonine protein kinase [Ktedonosporobacter rubrisoli]|uniref:serine/threonine protein kinase n=1 Tax=Ktedonosporobacter rubrisoli TaxID=2509675 RepID=UPI0013EE758C|nr:serine/threonine-protein kinase [Ktedonosporobacter rubrisoli]
MTQTALCTVCAKNPAQLPGRTGKLLAQRYRILAKVGEGGFGVVYKAQDRLRGNKIVAIKEIDLSSLSTQEKIDVTDSYNREITLLSKLSHKSLPAIHDHFTDPEHWYVVMDYIRGKTLEEILQTTRGGRLPIKQALEIGMKLCDVLAYLHGQNPPVIFRDVKPSNVMLTRKGNLYLIDFGIARLYRRDKRRDTGPLGSPGYAAPEQYGIAQTTAQTDIYGLGATLQTLLSGKEPLDIRADGWPADCNLPERLQTLLDCMMERDLKRRPADVKDLKWDLKWVASTLPKSRWQVGMASFWKLVINIVPQTMMLLLLSLLFPLVAAATGFLASSFWIPCLLAMLVVFVGCCISPLLAVSGARPLERWAALWRRLPRALFLTLLPALLFYIFYDSLRPGNTFAWVEVLLIGSVCATLDMLLFSVSKRLFRLLKHLRNLSRAYPGRSRTSIPPQKMSQHM